MSLLIDPISKKRQSLIDAINTSIIQVGDEIGVLEKHISEYGRNPERPVSCVVLEIDGDILTVKSKEYSHSEAKKIRTNQVHSRNTYYVGENPHLKIHTDVRFVAYSLESILFNLNVFGNKRDEKTTFRSNGIVIQDLNWNPYVLDKDGKKWFYQRGFVWTTEQNQLLIESIYQGIECGRILVRERSWETIDKATAAGDTEVAFNDLVDGKQRLNAIRSFMLEEYPDMRGNYFGDLSAYAQHKFTNHQLFAFATMPDNTADDEVIRQFLRSNFTGVPQSAEHIAYVQDIYKHLTK